MKSITIQYDNHPEGRVIFATPSDWICQKIADHGISYGFRFFEDTILSLMLAGF